jgi:hypothetical protein
MLLIFRQQYFPADQSLQLHSGNQTVPAQLVIRAPEASNFKTDLPDHTSLFHMRGELPAEDLRVKQNGVTLYTLPAALVFAVNPYLPKSDRCTGCVGFIGDSSKVLGNDNADGLNS